MLDETTMMGKIVTFSMLGLLGWLAFTTYNLSIEQAVMSTELKGVKELIVNMQTLYITKAEADTRFSILENEINRMRDTVRELVLDTENVTIRSQE